MGFRIEIKLQALRVYSKIGFSEEPEAYVAALKSLAVRRTDNGM